MRFIPLIVLACLLLAGLQAAATVLALVVLTAIVLGFINRTWETCAGLAFLTFLGLLQTRPAVALAVAVVMVALIGGLGLKRVTNRHTRASVPKTPPAQEEQLRTPALPFMPNDPDAER